MSLARRLITIKMPRGQNSQVTLRASALPRSAHGASRLNPVSDCS